VIPITASNPGARGNCRGESLDARHELVARGRVAQLDRGEAEPAVEEVHVRVDEAGNDERAAKVDDLCPTRQRADFVIGTDRDNPRTGNGDRVRGRACRVAGPHATIHQQQRRCRLLPACGRKREQHHENCGTESSTHGNILSFSRFAAGSWSWELEAGTELRS
jgi:hypothetical protein